MIAAARERLARIDIDDLLYRLCSPINLMIANAIAAGAIITVRVMA